jgi:hypothetical protein
MKLRLGVAVAALALFVPTAVAANGQLRRGTSDFARPAHAQLPGTHRILMRGLGDFR